MRRVIILMLDSFGVGATEDADKFGDIGANTLGHIAKDCASGMGDEDGLRSGPLTLPNLSKLGLGHLAEAASGIWPEGLEKVGEPTGLYGYAAELSNGKDTPSGHWEMAGVPVLFDWGYFPPDYPSFPSDLIDALLKGEDIPGILGNKAASGTDILTELGEEHIATGKPIIYTSADSVFQIAAHEEHFGLERLYALCEKAHKLVEPYNIGRVIARPFVGETAKTFTRTGNRHDYSVPPPEKTVLDMIKETNGHVIAIGKISDIYATCGVTESIKASGNDALFDATLKALETAEDRSLIFTNLVDFDMLFGHRRNVAGYAEALENLDARLPELDAKLQEGDLVIMTADHGCDPTADGTDHTREYVPVIAYGKGLPTGFIGKRDTFADIGQTVSTWLTAGKTPYGTTFLSTDGTAETV